MSLWFFEQVAWCFQPVPRVYYAFLTRHGGTGWKHRATGACDVDWHLPK